MYYVYFVSGVCRGMLYMLLVLLVLRQVLPFLGKRQSEFEKHVEKITQPILFAGDCFCKMMKVSMRPDGIDFRYPVISVFLWLCVIAVTVGLER